MSAVGRTIVVASLVGVVGLLAVSRADEPTRFSAWAAPALLETVDGPAANFFPAVSKDGLSLYFTVSTCPDPRVLVCLDDPNAFGGFDLYVAQRASVDEPWGAPQNVGATINSPYYDAAPSLSVDGHTLYFSSDRPDGIGGNDIYRSRRHDRRDDYGWQEPENLGTNVNTAANESGPEIFDDDANGTRTLFFESNRPGGPGPFVDDLARNGNDIYVSTQYADGSFGPATLVAELSTTAADRQPTIRRDGLELFLASARGGGLDIWTFTRVSTSQPWSGATDVTVLNSSANDAGPALSFDGLTLYFQSSRPANSVPFNLYESRRSKLK